MTQSPRRKNSRLGKGKRGKAFVFPVSEAKADFAQVLREAIIESGISQYHLSRVAGVAQGALSTFLSGKDVRLSTFNKLAQVMGFELRRSKTKSPKLA